MPKSELSIIRVHNELLGTYGDRGNADVLAFRASARGINSAIIDISYRDPIPTTGDIYLLGGAEDAAQVLSTDALNRSLFAATIDNGAVLLAICAGFQIIGKSYYAHGSKVDGVGLLDMDTVPGDRRYVGDIKVHSPWCESDITGFENHGGKTLLGSELSPFGEVITGFGNGESTIDGAVYGNIFGTYLHGPVLARNPEFADLLLARAVGKVLDPYEDELAERYATERRAAVR